MCLASAEMRALTFRIFLAPLLSVVVFIPLTPLVCRSQA